MPIASQIGRVVLIAVTLTGGGLLETEYGYLRGGMTPLPAEERSIFALAATESGMSSGETTSGPTSSDSGTVSPDSGTGQPAHGSSGEIKVEPTQPLLPPEVPMEIRPEGEPSRPERRREEFQKGEEMGPPGEEMRPPDEDCKRQVRESAVHLNRMMSDIERQLRNLKRRKVNIPPEVNELVGQVKALVERARGIETCDEAQEISEELPPLAGDLQEKLGELERCAFLPQVRKDINRQFNFIKRDWSRAQGRAKRAKNVDLTELLNEGGVLYGRLGEMKDQTIGLIDEITKSAECNRAEEIFELGEEARDVEEELREKVNTIMALGDSTRQLNFLKRDRKDFTRLVRDLKRQKKDPAELEACLPVFDENLAAIQEVLRGRPLNPEDLRDAFETTEDARHNCREIADELQGVRNFEAPELFKEFDLPSFAPPEVKQ
ncbi:hypothetical protein HY628_02445 [Candidatus Uhrbacteria bacterium]|nr:hypothetical protein [Candidatus Uhrbacteria bacterium]